MFDIQRVSIKFVYLRKHMVTLTLKAEAQTRTVKSWKVKNEFQNERNTSSRLEGIIHAFPVYVCVGCV